MSVTKPLHLFTIITLLSLVIIGCGDPGALDRAEASKLLRESEAAIEAARIAQEHQLAMERAGADLPSRWWPSSLVVALLSLGS
jgi:hypothetical protein